MTDPDDLDVVLQSERNGNVYYDVTFPDGRTAERVKVTPDGTVAPEARTRRNFSADDVDAVIDAVVDADPVAGPDDDD